jgi:hypothetical protein
MPRYELCGCCDEGTWAGREAECNGCGKRVCEDCIASVPEGWLCCKCRGGTHDEPTSADVEDWRGDDYYHSLKDEGKI